jgi:hypothetical protein
MPKQKTRITEAHISAMIEDRQWMPVKELQKKWGLNSRDWAFLSQNIEGLEKKSQSKKAI